MAVARPATDQDRLPWLDTTVRRRRRDLRPLLVALLGLGGFAAVAAFAFWFGQQSAVPVDADARKPVDYSVSRELGPATVAPAIEEPTPAPEPEPEPEPAANAAVEPAPVVRPERARQAEPRESAQRARSRPKAVARADRPAARRAGPAQPRRAVVQRRSGYWPTPATAVRLGRVIQIGVFSTTRSADAAWTKTLRRYPQVRGLPRISSSYVARNGRTYHRLQIMTTAPAQSQWLCRKMRSHGRRCTVLGSAA